MRQTLPLSIPRRATAAPFWNPSSRTLARKTSIWLSHFLGVGLVCRKAVSNEGCRVVSAAGSRWANSRQSALCRICR